MAQIYDIEKGKITFTKNVGGLEIAFGSVPKLVKKNTMATIVEKYITG